ncbi:pPIWI-associating nuclease domain-containing protein [Pontibacter sp. H249]|uniref:pPIWI-associating nuclease domain-containing protein n=1 Tax=Pontibacter sp. H249 TaxID=3133420 RepID=UPI0030C627B6
MGENNRDNSEDSRNNEERYKPIIDLITGINSKASVFAAQSAMMKNGMLSSSVNQYLKGISDQYSAISSIYQKLPDVAKISFESPILKATRDANKSIAAITGHTLAPQLAKAITEQAKISNGLQKSLAITMSPVSAGLQLDKSIKTLTAFQGIDKSIIAQFAISANIGKITEYALHAERNFSGLNWGSLGQSLGLNQIEKGLLSTSLVEYTTQFSKLCHSFQSNPSSLVGLNSTLARIPSIEFYNTSNVVEKITIDREDEVEEEILINDILIESEETLHSLLPKLDPELVRLWIGANQALNSNNIDKTRHFITSLRELFTHVFHLLAPDAEVKKWSTKPDDFHNGNPTRRARLLYITREINNEVFNDFLSIDIQSTLKLIELFNRGTHGVVSKLSEKQLVAIKCKAESTLKYLLQIHYADCL